MVRSVTGASPASGAPSRSRTIGAAILGNAFEFYDFTVYATFAAIIGRAFFPSGSPSTTLLLSVATFGVGFIARPLGGVVIGAFADRYGRKPAMTLTIWLMALGSGMIGLLPTYEQIGLSAPLLLVLARLIQGFSAGGEMGPATSFLIESAPPNRVAFFGSWQLSSQNMGVLAAALIGTGLAATLPTPDMDSWGWRIPFLIGVLIAPVGIYIRSRLEETLEESAHETMTGVLSELFRDYWPRIVLAILLISGMTITQYFFSYVTTYAITTLHMSTTIGMLAGVAGGVSGVIFAVVGGLLADRYGVKTVTIGARVIVTILFYPALQLVLAHPSPGLFLVVIAVLSAFHAASGAAGIILLPLSLPAGVRTAGLSIGYAVGVTIFGGTAQVIFTWLIQATGNPIAPIWYVVGTSVLSIIATALLPLQRRSA